VLRQLVQKMAKAPRLVATRGRIEDDTDAHVGMIFFLGG
jgi:hypothetical protein